MRKFYVLLLALFVTFATNAQVSSYSFTQTTGTYTPITGGTVLYTGTYSDNAVSAAVTIPSFVFNGTTYTSIRISTNGFITFGATAPTTSTYTAISGTGSYSGAVAAFAADLYASTRTGAAPEIRYETIGNEFIVQYRDSRRSGTGGATGEAISFQIRLNTSNNSISIVYGGTIAPGSSSTYPQVGLRGASNTDYKNRTITSGGGAWTNSTAGGTNTATMYFNSATPTTVPAVGTTFTWTPPSCSAPGGITATNISHNSATVNWNVAPGSPASYDYEIRTSGAAGSGATGLVTSGNTASTTANISSLTPNTTYSIYLRTDCGGGDISGWSGAVTFTTLCAPYATPTSSAETFATYLPSACWSEAAGLLAAPTTFTSTTSSSWTQDDFGNVTSPVNKAAKLNIFSTGSDEWLISPTYDLGSGGNLQLEFDLALTTYDATSANTLGPDDKFVVLISTDNGATWTSANILRQWNASTPISNTGEHIIISLSSYSGLVKFAFYGESTVSNADNDLFVDNFEIKVQPACGVPTGITLSSITTNSATVNWVAPSPSPAAYEIYYSTSNTAPTGGTTPSQTGIAGTSVNLSSLTSNTLYYVWVRSNCGVNGISDWTTLPGQFRTLCEATNALNENFDAISANSLPSCWSKIIRGASVSSFASVGASTSYARSAPNSVELYNSSSTSTDDIILVSPQLSNLGAGTHQLRFWARNTTSSQDLVIGTLSSNTSGAIFTPITTVDVTTTFQEFTVSFTGYSGSDQYIGIRRLSTSTYTYVYVDDVIWEAAPTTPCAAPADQATSLTFGTQGITSQAGSFTAAASAPTGYLVVRSMGALNTTPVNGTIYTSGNTLGNGTVIQSGTSVSFTASGLTGNTEYTYTVFAYNNTSCLGGPAYNTSSPLVASSVTCPATPASVSVTNKTSNSFYLNWTSSKGGGYVNPMEYTVDVATDNAFASPIAGSPFIVSDTTTTQNTMRFAVTGLNGTTTYYYRIKGNACNTNYSSTSSTTTLDVPPVNDDAVGAIDLTVGAGCSGNPYTNANATQSINEPFARCKGTAAGYSTVWFKFIAPASGAVKISNDFSGGTMGSDSRLSLFSTTNASDYSSFSLIGCDDDNGVTVSSRSVIYATGLSAGAIYYIQVDGYSGSTATGTFCIAVDELSSSMLVTSGSCASGQDLSGINTGYTGWLSLVDGSGRLVAQVRDLAGSGGTYSNSTTITTGAVRQSGGIYYLNRNYLINNSAATNVQVQFFFLDAELTALNAINGATLANIGVVRQTGTTCRSTFSSANGSSSFLSQTANGSTNGVSWIEVTTPAFSNFYIQASGGAILPAQLMTFSGARQGNSNLLKWTVAQEQDVQSYEVERSDDAGRTWNKAGSVNSLGNTTVQRSYHFTDNNIQGTKQLYRLRMVDRNGTSKLSGIVSINGVKPLALAVSGVFPNPAASKLNVLVDAPQKENITIEIMDAVGRVVKMQKATLEIGANTIQLQVGGLAQGTYLLKVSSENHAESIMSKFIKE